MLACFKNRKLPGYGGLLILVAVIVLVFGTEIYFLQKRGYCDGDYKYHLDLAQKMIESRSIIANNIPTHVSTHPLYHLLSLLCSAIKGVSLKAAGYYIVPLLSYILLGICLYKKIAGQRPPAGNGGISPDAIIIPLCLMLVGPISLFTFPNLYFGYIGMNVYHNPTQLLAQPLSLITFLLVLTGLERRAAGAGFLLWLALVTFLSLMAKPGYLICLIPILILFALYRVYKKIFINMHVLFVFLAATFLVLAWQYWITYGASGPDSESKIIIAPFEVWRFIGILAGQFWSCYGISDAGSANKIISAPLLFMYQFPYAFLPRLILSALFPAAVYLAFFTETKKNTGLNIAWLTFGLAFFYSCFLAESGHRLYHGNFFWGLQTALFILYVSSAIFLVREQGFSIRKNLVSRKKNPRLFFCGCIFGLHLLSGVAYYVKIAYGGWYG